MRPFLMRKIFILPGLLAFLIAGWWAYYPGLSGTFLFDDFNNLDKLGTYGGVRDLRSLLFYLSSGTADPTGRPLALLSFLIDARDWPADPESFKRSNILLHLLNGLLLSCVLLKLGLRMGLTQIHARLAGLMGAAIWMLHPFLVSTTLYVVQREAMLPATFTLSGMLLWLSGRERLLRKQRGGIPLMMAAAWGCATLALLCKANGALLPLLLLTMEWTLLAPATDLPAGAVQNARLRIVRRWLLQVPSGLLAAWLFTKVPEVFSGETYSRPWTIGQRLLTEPRVLCDYLKQLWIPRASGASLFNDGYHASIDLFHPWSTLPAIGVISLLILLGLRLRHKHPAAAFAILFYFAGQLLESTLIPLELYFEHRNYLPAMLLFWPLAIWLTGTGALHRLRYALAILLLGILAALCHLRAGIWGQPFEQALLLAQTNPESPRGQANAAAYELAHGAANLASHRLEASVARMPDEVQLTLNWIDAQCALGGVSAKTRDAALYSLRHNLSNNEFVQNWMIGAIDRVTQDRCPGIDLQILAAMAQAFSENPNYGDGPEHRFQVAQLQGRLSLAQGDGEAALHDFNEGLSALSTPDRALQQAALLGNAGFPDLGLKHLDYYRTLPPGDRRLHGMAAIHLWLLDYEGYWAKEFAGIEEQLRADATARGLIVPSRDKAPPTRPRTNE